MMILSPCSPASPMFGTKERWWCLDTDLQALAQGATQLAAARTTSIVIHCLVDRQRCNVGIGSRAAGLSIINWVNLIVDGIFIHNLGQGWRHNRAWDITFSCNYYNGVFQASDGVCLVLRWRWWHWIVLGPVAARSWKFFESNILIKIDLSLVMKSYVYNGVRWRWRITWRRTCVLRGTVNIGALLRLVGGASDGCVLGSWDPPGIQ
jgi:hypothetical protein